MHHNLAVVHGARGEYKEALTVLKELLPTDSSVEERILLAKYQIANGQWPEARSTLTGCLAEDPDSLPALGLLAWLAKREGRPEEAIALNLRIVAFALDAQRQALPLHHGVGIEQARLQQIRHDHVPGGEHHAHGGQSAQAGRGQ